MAETSLDILLRARGGRDTANEIGSVVGIISQTRAEVERFSAKGGLAAIAVGSNAITKAAAEAQTLGDELLRDVRQIQELEIALRKAEAEGDGDGFRRISDQLRQLRSQAADTADALTRIPRDLREGVNDAVGAFGDLDSSFAQISSSLTGLGTSPLGRLAGAGVLSGPGPLANIGAGFQVGSDVFALAEALPRLSGSLQQVKANTLTYITSAGQQAIANSTLAASAAATVTPLGGTAASLTAIAVAAAPFLVAGAAVAGGLFLLNKELAEGRKRSDESVQAIKKREDALRLEYEILTTLNAEQAKRQQQGLQGELDVITQSRDALVAELQKQFGDATIFEQLSVTDLKPEDLLGEDINKLLENTIFDPRGAAFVANQVVDGIVKLGGGSGIESTLKEIAEYNKQIEALNGDISIYSEQINELINRENQQAAIDAAKASATEYVQSLYAQSEAAQRTAADIERLSGESAQQQVDDLKTRIAANEEAADAILKQIYTNQEAAQNGLAANAAEMAAANEVLADELATLQTSIAADSAEVARLTDEVIPLVEAREREEKAVEDLKARQEELVASQRQAADQLASVRDQITDITEQFAEKEKLRQAEDAIKAARDAEDKLFQKRIDAAKATDAAAKAQDRQRQLVTETRQKEADINRKFMEGQLKASQEFHKKESRIVEDEQNERLRKLRDFSDQLLEAYEGNDVRTFARTLRDRNRFLQDDTADNSIEARRRGEDFVAQSNEAQAAREKELEALTAHFQERQAQELAARSEQESEVDRIQREWDRVRQQRLVEDEQRKLQIERDAHQTRLGNLRRQESELSTRIAGINAQLAASIFNNILSKANQALGTVQAVRQYATPIGPQLSGNIPAVNRQTTTNVNINRLNFGEIVTPNQLQNEMIKVQRVMRKSLGL